MVFLVKTPLYKGLELVQFVFKLIRITRFHKNTKLRT